MRVLVVVLMLAQAAAGNAADRAISGVKLLLTRSSSGSEKLTFVSKDVNFLFPALGGADDPSAGGASITIVSPLEAPVTLAVPGGIGNPGWRVTDRTLDNYSYRNGSAPLGPSVVRVLSLREGRGIKLVAREVGLALAAAQGSVGIRITTGGSRRCALFDQTSVVVDQPARFVGRGSAATMADCSDAALGFVGDPCGNGVIDSPEECDGTTFPPGAPPSSLGLQCNAPGSPNECQICAVTSCKWFFSTFPCCDPAATCVAANQFQGECLLPTTTSTSTTSSTSTTLFPGCGNGAVGPGEECDGSGDACGFGPGGYAGCFPPGYPNECTCCGNVECYEGGAGGLFHCCEGLTCAYYPPFTGGVSFGLGQCVSGCAPLGTSCNSLPCCAGTCAPLPQAPTFPFYFCQ